jgi:hypothetical protein
VQGEPYGDFLTHPRGHYDVWSSWQTLSAAALAKQDIPQAVAYHEYEDFSRGRIVFQIKSGQFIVYADRRLQRSDVVTDIATLFAIAPGTFLVRSDAHYLTSSDPISTLHRRFACARLSRPCRPKRLSRLCIGFVPKLYSCLAQGFPLQSDSVGLESI